MVSTLINLWTSFLAGLFAPLGAVCVLPLYPGFLAYLASQAENKKGEIKKSTLVTLGLIVTFGVILSMFLIGLIFTYILSTSLTRVIGIISPIAFVLLGIASIFLILGKDIGNIFPKVNSPITKNPYMSALLFGLFFGAIVLPCNPASLIVLFAVSTGVTDFVTNLFNFIVFGIGMGIPLLLLAILSAQGGGRVIRYLTSHKTGINRAAGIIMLGISLYYLHYVFDVFGLLR